MSDQQNSCLMVIFGATGDLANRKLFPALYSLFRDGVLPEHFAVVGVARREKAPEEFRRDVWEAVRRNSRFEIGDDEIWRDFSGRFYYLRSDLREPGTYGRLKSLLGELDERYQVAGNRIYYLAVAPEHFSPIVENLAAAGLTVIRQGSRGEGSRGAAESGDGRESEQGSHPPGWQRLVIEKPFGHDLASAESLNRQIRAVFDEEQIFRIDHYLGKEMTQNIMVIRFANAFFEPVWNRRFIESIQITSSETGGVEDRGNYYEKAGALRDMVQNHMLQLLTMIAMEPPSSLQTEAIRDEKVKVLRSLKPMDPEEIRKNVVRGQYGAGAIKGQKVAGYRQEPKVGPASDTETFVAMKLFVENFRWAGVPFYVRTGKRLPVKATEIVVQFKSLPEILYFKEYGKLAPNLLVLRVSPQEGLFVRLNTKKPGTEDFIAPVAMDFCQKCEAEANSPEAYERLLFDVMRGDSTLFTRWDEVALAWNFVDPMARAWAERAPAFPNYAAGSWGPEEQARLFEAGAGWWPVYGQEGAEKVLG